MPEFDSPWDYHSMIDTFWYKYESRFGAGHQSKEIRYFYEHTKLDAAWIKEYEREEANRIANKYDTDCVTQVDLVQTVPADVIANMRRSAQRSITRNNQILAALDDLEKKQSG